ncbi:MAG: chromate transporter [Betaproteobacteria bacterium]|nr:chromate transporter [Betaproteobacteria bacterium]
MNPSTQASYSLWTSLRFWFVLGWTSFGGPAAQIAMMQAELVEKRRWISPHRFVHALNYCMVLPGPEAHQLATYMGWLLHGPWGGLVAGTLFILPSLAIMTGFGFLYVTYGEMPEVQALLYGLKPAVLAIVIAATLRLGQRVLTGPLWWGIAGGSFVLLLLHASFVVVIALAALVGFTMPFCSIHASTSSPLTSASIWPSISTQGESSWPLFWIISTRWLISFQMSRSSKPRPYLAMTALTPRLHPQWGLR